MQSAGTCSTLSDCFHHSPPLPTAQFQNYVHILWTVLQEIEFQRMMERNETRGEGRADPLQSWSWPIVYLGKAHNIHLGGIWFWRRPWLSQCRFMWVKSHLKNSKGKFKGKNESKTTYTQQYLELCLAAVEFYKLIMYYEPAELFSDQMPQLPPRKLSGLCKCHHQYVCPWAFIFKNSSYWWLGLPWWCSSTS